MGRLQVPIQYEVCCCLTQEAWKYIFDFILIFMDFSGYDLYGIKGTWLKDNNFEYQFNAQKQLKTLHV